MAELEDITTLAVETLHPADLADQLQRVETDAALETLTRLEPARAAATLAELEAERAEELLARLGEDQLCALLKQLPHPEAADLLQFLEAGRRARTLAALPPELSEALKALLLHSPDTAGGIMSDRFIVLRENQTLAQALDALRARKPDSSDDVSYLYVSDPRRRLTGIISLRDLVFRQPQRTVSEVMNRSVATVHVNTDQEELARQFEHYHYLGLPVVDDRQRLVGVVKATDILQVATEEATEDMQLMVGLSGEERALTPWHRSVRHRLPWLYVNLITAFLAAAVVNLFESTIAKWTALAVFLPIIAGQGGNAGMQTLTVIIRDMALGEIAPGDGWRVLRKELLLGAVNGLAVGLAVGLLGWIWKDSPELGLVAGGAMILNQLAAALSGVLIPFGLKRLNLDPALASSIFVTTVTDVAGFFFFLALAAGLMRAMGML